MKSLMDVQGIERLFSQSHVLPLVTGWVCAINSSVEIVNGFMGC